MKREKFIKLLKSNVKLMEFIIVDASSDNLIDVKHNKHIATLQEIYNSNNGVLYEQYNEFLIIQKSIKLTNEFTSVNKILDEIHYADNFYFNKTMDEYGNDYLNIYEISNLEQAKFEKFANALKEEIGNHLDNNCVKKLHLTKEQMSEAVKRAAEDVKTLPPWKDPSKNKGNKK